MIPRFNSIIFYQISQKLSYFCKKKFFKYWGLQGAERGVGGSMTPGPMDFRGPMGFRKAVGFSGPSRGSRGGPSK